MSQLVGAALPTSVVEPNVWALQPQFFRPESEIPWCIRPEPEFRTPWWPRNPSWLVGIDEGSVGMLWDTESFEEIEPTSGSSGRYGFYGVTRDAFGTPVSGVTIKCYLTADDSLVSRTVSDASGAYLVTTQYYPNAHYLVAYKAGSPDISGTTVNSLIAG